jgi:hypothetical protein
VRLKGQQVRCELTSARPGKTVLHVVYLGKELLRRQDLSGDPPQLAAIFRERCRSPLDVVALATKMGQAA